MTISKKKNPSLESDHKASKEIAEEYVIESEVLLQQTDHPNNEKYIILKDKGVIQKEKYDFKQFLQGATTRIN